MMRLFTSVYVPNDASASKRSPTQPSSVKVNILPTAEE
jgi:hypothetical protein